MTGKIQSSEPHDRVGSEGWPCNKTKRVVPVARPEILADRGGHVVRVREFHDLEMVDVNVEGMLVRALQNPLLC